jgi:hypothetical protein
MTTFVAVALALSLAHYGKNGLDPFQITLLPQGGVAMIDPARSPEFADWLRADPEARADTMHYFVACALDATQVVTFQQWTWRGDLGLAPTLRQAFVTNARERRPFKITFTPDEGMWLSACLMAHANLAGSHEYISIRGNPPGNATLTPDADELWTMSYPEGVFLADVFEQPPAMQPSTPAPAQPRGGTVEDLKWSFTYALTAEPTSTWYPPNATVGRTLDFDPETKVHGKVVARRKGTYPTDASCSGAMTLPDPKYKIDRCTVEGRSLRPLFVHGPGLVNFEDAEQAGAPAKPFQILSTDDPIAPGQRVTCGQSRLCIGPVPPSGNLTADAARVEKLAGKQSLVVVLREPASLSGREARVDAERVFTALVRYGSESLAVAQVDVLVEGQGWVAAGSAWPSTAPGERWMQVFPVKPASIPKTLGGGRGLAIRISPVVPATAAKAGSSVHDPAPKLDAAGFVPGRPWCYSGSAIFMAPCTQALLPAERVRRGRPVLRR